MKIWQWILAVALTGAASVGILAFGWHPVAHALPGGGATAAAAKAPVRARGQLVAVDLARQTVTLDVGATPLTLNVADGTAIFVGGEFADLADLPLGGQVCAAMGAASSAVPTAEWLEPC